MGALLMLGLWLLSGTLPPHVLTGGCGGYMLAGGANQSHSWVFGVAIMSVMIVGLT